MGSGGGSGGTLIAGAAIVGGLVFAYLYFTKEFCPDGAYPNDALCYKPGRGNIDEDTASCETLCSYAYCDSIAERRKAGKCKGVCKHCDPSSAGGGPEVGDPHKQKTPSACAAWGGVWKANQCNCNTVIKKCAAGKVAGILNGKCTCGTPKKGAVVSGSGSAGGTPGAKVTGGAKVPLSGTQLNNGKLLIASAVATVIRSCAGSSPSSTEIVRGWPSAITQLAQMNNYNTTKIVQYNNRPFAALFRKVVVSAMNAYKLKNKVSGCAERIGCLGSGSLKECGLL